MTNEDSVLEELMDNLREAARCIRATQNVMHSQGMTQDENYRELLMRLRTIPCLENPLTEGYVLYSARSPA